jgi:endo-1,3-1,4-beta-glycanase ExoK
VLDWDDQFDTLDPTRWTTANWTFEGNLVDFDPANAVVQDGTLILALTKEGARGFSGTVPVDDGTTTGPVTPPKTDDSGCSMAGRPSSSGGFFTVVALGLVTLLGRRRCRRV